MVTPFGKLLRKLRIDRGEVLKHMADSLGVSTSFLSAVETGKKNVPGSWVNKLSKIYSLTNEEKEELGFAADRSQSVMTFDLKNQNEDDRDLLVVFARNLEKLNPEKKAALKKLLEEDPE